MNFAMGMNVIYAEEAKRELAAEKAEQAVAYTFNKPAHRFSLVNMFRALFH
ncbi:hypothetical protein OAP63_00565 [Vibrio sp.]|uniref:hypothetical protein n=1 Tax=Vibrio viridaestus TaxID=2487322 RepID=UPI00140B263C|nr:hypothetical protein [Vibrio viridaestus]MDC0609200.1 hypothetical protein [Vibrio sp.]